MLARYYLFYLYWGQFRQNHQLAWKKTDCLKHHCTAEPMLCKQCVEKTLLSWPIWQICSQETPDGEAKPCQNALVDQGEQRQGNTVLWTDESKFKIFRSNRRDYVQRRIGERAATSCVSTTVKNRGGSIMVCAGAIGHLQSRGFALVEGQIESDQLSQHAAASCDLIWNAVYGSRICTHARWWPKVHS